MGHRCINIVSGADSQCKQLCRGQIRGTSDVPPKPLRSVVQGRRPPQLRPGREAEHESKRDVRNEGPSRWKLTQQGAMRGSTTKVQTRSTRVGSIPEEERDSRRAARQSAAEHCVTFTLGRKGGPTRSREGTQQLLAAAKVQPATRHFPPGSGQDEELEEAREAER